MIDACLAPLLALAELFLCLLLAAGFAGNGTFPACLVARTSSSASPSEYDSLSYPFSVTVDQDREKSVISAAVD